MVKNIRVFVLALGICLTSCGQVERSLLDFKKYKYIDIDNISFIEISWDVNDYQPILFSISEKKDVDFIISSYCVSDAFVKSDVAFGSGNHSILKLVDVNSIETLINLTYIEEDGKTFVYKTNDIKEYVYNIGVELGYLK